MKRALAVALLLALAGSARAERPTLDPEIDLFGRPLFVPGAGSYTAVGVRWSLFVGFALPHCLELRVGPMLEAFTNGPAGAAVGGDAQLDGPIVGGLRVGGGAAVAAGSAGPECVACGDGTIVQAGPRVRLAYLTIGADAVMVHGGLANAYGFELRVGLDHRPGRIAFAASGIVGLVLGVIGAIAYLNLGD